MKSLYRGLFAGLLLAALSAGCSKQKTVSEAPEETAVMETPSTPLPAPKPAGTSVAAVATPPPKRLAPDGIFFLLAKKSLETTDGIIGFKPGTQVKRQEDGSYLAEGKVLQLRADEITNDLDVAVRVIGMDAQRQAALRQVTALQAAAAAATPLQAAARSGNSGSASVVTPASISSAPAPASSSSSSLGGSSALGSTHSMTRDGWLWEKNRYGEWRRVKPLR